jgi:hypothetical protein
VSSAEVLLGLGAGVVASQAEVMANIFNFSQFDITADRLISIIGKIGTLGTAGKEFVPFLLRCFQRDSATFQEHDSGITQVWSFAAVDAQV